MAIQSTEQSTVHSCVSEKVTVSPSKLLILIGFSLYGVVPSDDVWVAPMTQSDDGEELGVPLGTADGFALGPKLGELDGTREGATLGVTVGAPVGTELGTALGECDGEPLGATLG